MRIGVVVDNHANPPSWVLQILDRLQSDAAFELIVFGVASGDQAADTKHSGSLGQPRGLGRWIAKLESALIPNPFRSAVASVSSQSNFDFKTVNELSLGSLAENLCDFVFVATPGVSFSKIEELGRDSASQFLSFRNFPSGCFGRQDVIRGDSISSLDLIVCGPEGRPSVVESSRIDSESSWQRNRGKLLSAAPDTLMRFLIRCNDRVQESVQSDSTPIRELESTVVEGADSNSGMLNDLSYLSRLSGSLFQKAFVNKTATLLRKTLGNGEPGYWTVRYGSLADDIANWPSIQLDPKSRWVADPFLIVNENQKFVIFEDWSVSKKIGTISAANLETPDKIFSVLDNSFHLSYPFTFFRAGEWYMIPECNQSGHVSLYRLKFSDDGMSFEVELVRHLLDGEFVDSTLVRLGDKDFLLTNPRKPYSKTFNCALEVYICDDVTLPDSQPSPHPLNPVVIDPVLGRNGGRAVEISETDTTASERDDKAKFLIKRLSQKNDRKYGEDLVESLVAIDERNFQTISHRTLDKAKCARRHHLDEQDGFGTTDLFYNHRLL